MKKSLYGVVVIRDAHEIMDYPSEPFIVRIYLFDSMLKQLNFYAETPCLWSECIEADTIEELEEMAKTVFQKFLNGEYNDYM